MAFCPNCGVKLTDSPKFCPGCGHKLDINIPSSPKPEAPPKIEEKKPEVILPKKFDLGVKLEEVVEKIYQADGYSTEKRRRVQGKANYSNEIDIMAIRGSEKVAIECKNFSSPVGISPIRDFVQKLEDLGHEWRGVFVAYSDFTSEASEFAESRNIEKIGHDELKERWIAVSIGRTAIQGDKLTLNDALPINFNYLEATALQLINKDKIRISDAKLLFYPYLRIPYHLQGKRRDPTKEVHEFEDEGVIVLDLIDGEILNPPITDDAGAMLQAIKRVTSPSVRADFTLRNKLMDEIIENEPTKEYSVTIGQDYQITKSKAEYGNRDMKRLALDYIIERNTMNVEYELPGKGDFGTSERRTMEIVPKRNEIKLLSDEIVLVPKWIIHFNALGTIYTREMFACSGTMLEDTVRYCPSHFKLGILQIKKETKAVCEKCGKAYCNDHISQCPACKSWFCDADSIQCVSCNRSFCKDHITKECKISKGSICSDCLVTCPICKREYGKNLQVVCDQCGSKVCKECVTVKGLLKKTRTCKNCG